MIIVSALLLLIRQQVDHDGDGQVSYEEFRKMVLDFNKRGAGRWEGKFTFIVVPFWHNAIANTTRRKLLYDLN